MATLEPCPGCQRHVKIDEASCPFCGAALAEHFERLPARSLPRTRLTRAALFAFGVGASGALVGSCAKEHDDDDEKQSDGGTPEDGDDGDDGNVQPVYGAPPEEDAGTQVGGDEDAGGVFPLYGGAPSD
jgi:hypothetical protein